MPKIIDIPSVGQVEFPDSMDDSAISAAAKKLYDEASAPAQLPSQISIQPVDVQAAEAARKAQMPNASEQLQVLKDQSNRFNQAFISGIAGLPLGVLQAQEEFQRQIPAVRAVEKTGLKVASLREELASRLPEPIAGTVTFEPKNLAETGVVVGGGLLALEEPAMNAAAKAADEATSLARRGIDELIDIENTRAFKQVGQLPIEVDGRPVKEVIDDRITKLERVVSKQKQAEDRLVMKAARVEDQINSKIRDIDDELEQAAQLDLGNMDAINTQMSRLDAKRLDLQERIAGIQKAEFQYTPPTGKVEGDISRIDSEISTLENQIKELGGKRGTVNAKKQLAAKQKERTLALEQANELFRIDQPSELDAQRLAFNTKKQKQLDKLQKQLNDTIELQSDYRTIGLGASDDLKKAKLVDIRKKLGDRRANLELQQKVELNKVSDDWAAQADYWLKQRKKYAKLIGQESVDATADKFAEADEYLKRLQDFKDNLTFTYQTIPSKVTARTWSPTLAVDLAREQAQKVTQLAKLKVIPESQVAPLTNLVFEDTLKLQGFVPKTQWVVPPKVANMWLNATNAMNSIQRKLGVRTGETALKATQAIPSMQNYTARQLKTIQPAVENLKKLGYSNQEITRVLQYFETVAVPAKGLGPENTVRFTTAGLDIPGTRIPAWDPTIPAPTPEAQQSFIQLRQWLNDTAGEMGLEYRQRYIPIMATIADDASAAKTGVRSISTPAFEQVRKVGELVPGVTETDFDKIALRYTKNLARSKFARPVLKDAYDQVTMLRMMGQNTAASNLEDYVVDVFNLKNVDEFKRAFIANTFEDALPYIKQALKNSELNELQQYEGMNQLLNALQESAAVNLAGINPRVWMLQAMQPEATLTPLVGFRRVEQARFTRAPLSERPRLDRLLSASLANDLEVIDGFAGPQTTASIPKLIQTLNKPAKKLAEATMGSMERKNRIIGIKAADLLFDEAWTKGQTAGLEQIAFKHLNESQRNFVRTAFQQGGLESARDAFAVIITNQANMIYNIADKPKVLRNDLLRRIMFTTFSRGIANQMATALQEGRVSSVAAQIIKPLALASVLAGGSKLLTGKGVAVPGLNPIDSVAGLVSTEVRPAPLLPLTVSGALPVVGIYKQIERLPKRKFVQEVEDIPDFLFKNFEETERLLSGKKRR